jgi:hypothetical protein
MKNPLTKIGKIRFVKLKNALGKINNPLWKMENPVGKNEKSGR